MGYTGTPLRTSRLYRPIGIVPRKDPREPHPVPPFGPASLLYLRCRSFTRYRYLQPSTGSFARSRTLNHIRFHRSAISLHVVRISLRDPRCHVTASPPLVLSALFGFIRFWLKSLEIMSSRAQHRITAHSLLLHNRLASMHYTLQRFLYFIALARLAPI